MSKKLFTIVSLIIVLSLALAACAPAATAVPAAPKQVEVFSWWVGPGEADGLAAMVKVFQCQIP